jgi:hypothetical protein
MGELNFFLNNFNFEFIIQHEQCGNGNNDKQIIKFKKWVYEKYFWKIDKNGLIQFVRIDNKIWCQNDDLELDECIKR